ncbi:MAG TPA: hypothetical protein VE572_05895 [Nitrososphaeraceae archaeon]|nr:hypothetical protein [Nitrososphaeraceae archaeon]
MEKKTEFGLALSSPHDPGLHQPADQQSVANPPQKGQGHYHNRTLSVFCSLP